MKITLQSHFDLADRIRAMIWALEHKETLTDAEQVALASLRSQYNLHLQQAEVQDQYIRMRNG